MNVRCRRLLPGLLVLSVANICAAETPVGLDSRLPTVWDYKTLCVGRYNTGTGTVGTVMSDVIRLSNGTYRLYFNRSGGPSNEHISVAYSSNGLGWTYGGDLVDSSPDPTNAFFSIGGPRVLALSNGTYRMYVRATPDHGNQAAQYRTYSFISTNSLSFTQEPGIRIPIATDDPASPFSLAGHGAYFQLSNGTFACIISANATNDPAASDLFLGLSPDGLTWGDFRLLYTDFHDPVVFRFNNQFYFIAKYLREAICVGSSSDGTNWPSESSLVELNFYAADGTNITEFIGDVGAAVSPEGEIWVFSNWIPERRHDAGSIALARFDPAVRPRGDYDGDGRRDFAVYEANGSWFILSATGSALAWASTWGGTGLEPVSGDFDGNRSFDLAVQSETTGAWFVRSLAGTTLAWNTLWGGAGFEPVSGDFDGDGRYDYALYHEATGGWYVYSPTNGILAWGSIWGGTGFDPAPGDYDGDGRCDYAVYHEAGGAWFVRSPTDTLIAWNLGCGGPGFSPVPGDYDGNGRLDPAVYGDASGLWYALTLEGATLMAGLAFGSANCDPIPGDYDADGLTDLGVYDRVTGIWYVFRTSDQVLMAVTWGGADFTAVR
ncbi:MAG: hypothetical protein HY343_01415 [Lentisphaerae bacterium]|nr:hypothetical protein [Lentisphaerota bacterium]